ncbi:NAD(P)-binding domain-containing protein [Glycomyces algeriensis]|uniref:Pyrroline-5-carboxylate reductase n=1 Tax=Glycomyces algeriensis TaxID=256037 RepID=A0A9W6G620_9ACTN|nr:NAD(P)-binding domain-containing protein [Glycomyces algeriensis]MDA1367246.1 NAD(P)-binding domain-containing protein [Glycomyces algeriensis]MDR7353370.1 pyrroline-5-carboxylate reductase [Glycomyces algeriensis]GLI41065.1 pyrroline-5-carboxylate reductase [Glycomyces algeriensis]
MERIGFIGVGEISSAMVEGLSDGVDAPPPISLSPRGAATAAALAERYPNAQVRASNQEVADHADLLVIAVRHADRHDALAGLRIGADTTIVNVIPGVPEAELRELLQTEADIVAAIPLPTVRERESVTVTYPAHPAVDALFARLGGAQPVADTTAYNVCSSLSSTLSTHYAYLAALTEWAARHGVPPEAADRYVRSVYQGVGRSLGDAARPLDRLAAEHETPGGSNERIRTTWFDTANAAALQAALNGLLADLEQPQ